MDQSQQPPAAGTPPAGGNPPVGGASPPQSQPPGQGQPPQGQGAAPQSAGSPPQGAGTQPPADNKSYLRPLPPDHELGIGSVGGFSTTVTVPPHPNTKFDEGYFLKMLSGSISLTKNEKKKIVESVPKLSQYQIDELIKIFEEERRKFAELDDKHQVKIRELQQKQTDDWKDLEMEKVQTAQKGDEEAAAAALRAKLMSGSPVRICPACKAQVTDPKATQCPKCLAKL